MSLRKTACGACKAAKRRCDAQYPMCSRCTKQSLQCNYPYPPIPPSLSLTPDTDAHLTNADIPTTHVIPSTPVQAPSNLFASPIQDPPDPEWDFINHVSQSSSQESQQSQQSSSSTLNQNSVSQQTTNTPTLLLESSISRTSRSIQAEPGSQNLARRRRKRQYRPFPGQPSSVPRQLLQLHFPRAQDTKAWLYCAAGFMSLIKSFSRTASNGFIMSPSAFTTTSGLPTSLQRAFAVCAAHETLDKGGRIAFDNLLETETTALIDSSTYTAAFDFGLDGTTAVATFREDLARLQAMSLYQAMRLFGPDRRQRQLGEGLEPLYASWTREMLLKTQLLEVSRIWPQPSLTIGSPMPQPTVANHNTLNSTPLLPEEIDMAYRTVIVSYLIRGIYNVLHYKLCHLIQEIQHLPISIPGYLSPSTPPTADGRYDPKARHKVLYGEFADTWAIQPLASKAGYDDFLILMLVACNGTRVLPCINASKTGVWEGHNFAPCGGLAPMEPNAISC